MSRLFSYLMEGDGDSVTLKLLSKIVTLADDLVMDVVLHSDTTDGVHVGSLEFDEKLVSALTTRQWCMVPLQMMDIQSRQIQRKMLETMTNLAPHCFYDDKQIKNSAGKMMLMISGNGDGPIGADLVDKLRYRVQYFLLTSKVHLECIFVLLTYDDNKTSCPTITQTPYSNILCMHIQSKSSVTDQSSKRDRQDSDDFRINQL